MKLKRLVLKNYRGFETLNLKFHPKVTVLAGVNGSGKTSVLDAIFRGLVPMMKPDTSCGFSPMDTRLGQRSGEAVLTIEISGRPFSGTFLAVEGGWKEGALTPVGFTDTQKASGPLPVWVYYTVERHAADGTPGSTNPGVWEAKKAWEPSVGRSSFKDFFHWFREREDVENEERRDDSGFVDHQLQAVRHALEMMLPGYEKPRVRRPRFGQNKNGNLSVDKPVLAITKDGEELAFEQLSEGERTTAALVCDIARRLAIANPGSDSNPLEGEGVVLIDEIDLHLHPSWQARIIPALEKTFPHLQFVVTTHSPIVLSYVSSESVQLIKEFELVERLSNTRGRDPNAVLTDVFDWW